MNSALQLMHHTCIHLFKSLIMTDKDTSSQHDPKTSLVMKIVLMHGIS